MRVCFDSENMQLACYGEVLGSKATCALLACCRVYVSVPSEWLQLLQDVRQEHLRLVHTNTRLCCVFLMPAAVAGFGGSLQLGSHQPDAAVCLL